MKRAPKQAVLVATDLAPGGDEAIRQADAWARRIERPLVVFHALPEPLSIAPLFPQSGLQASDWAGQLRDLAIDAIEQRLADLTGRGPEDYKLLLEHGSPHGGILEAADLLDPELLVVGVGEHRRLHELLLGSTAEQVVRHARVPVLVARPSPASGMIMAATDLGEEALPALRAAASEAKSRGARMLGLHCLDLAHPALTAFEPTLRIDRETLEALRKGAEGVLAAALGRAGAPEDCEARVIHGKPARCIAALARERELELVVVATHGRTGLKRLTMGSVAVAVVRMTPCSVLVVRSLLVS